MPVPRTGVEGRGRSNHVYSLVTKCIYIFYRRKTWWNPPQKWLVVANSVLHLIYMYTSRPVEATSPNTYTLHMCTGLFKKKNRSMSASLIHSVAFFRNPPKAAMNEEEGPTQQRGNTGTSEFVCKHPSGIVTLGGSGWSSLHWAYVRQSPLWA